MNFTTPEIDPFAPKINRAVLSEDESFITIDWMLNQDCPGYIKRYEFVISCNVDEATASGILSFDCRTGIQGPLLNEAVPRKCNGEDLYIKVRDRLIFF